MQVPVREEHGAEEQSGVEGVVFPGDVCRGRGDIVDDYDLEFIGEVAPSEDGSVSRSVRRWRCKLSGHGGLLHAWWVNVE